MRKVQAILCLVAMAAFLPSCATMGGSGSFPDWAKPGRCAALGALAGGVGTTVAATQDNDEFSVGYGLLGTAVLATAGYFICKHFADDDPAPMKPKPRAQAPAPSKEVKEKIILRGVFFDFDKDNIRGDSAVILDEAARILKKNRGVSVSVEGHTDATGPDAYNQDLSQRRAASVKGYLVDKGVSGSRLSTRGYGESQPVADNDSRDGRAMNRRVELKVR